MIFGRNVPDFIETQCSSRPSCNGNKIRKINDDDAKFYDAVIKELTGTRQDSFEKMIIKL